MKRDNKKLAVRVSWLVLVVLAIGLVIYVGQEINQMIARTMTALNNPQFGPSTPKDRQINLPTLPLLPESVFIGLSVLLITPMLIASLVHFWRVADQPVDSRFGIYFTSLLVGMFSLIMFMLILADKY